MGTAGELSNPIEDIQAAGADTLAESLDDVRLVGAARGGDPAAFGQLYERYSRLVHGVLLSRVPPGEVEDLVQDVFLTAWRRLRDLRDASAFGAWLAAIARNRAADHHRRPAIHDEVHEDIPAESGNTSEALAILRAIQTLPDAYRETLVLRLVEGLSGPEIAERTGLTHGSVRVNLHRGMQQLREKLGKDL
ncbi:MAG: RNA polymerase sigma factor [Terriglobia bacterium]